MDVDDFVGGTESPSSLGARIAGNAEAMREALSKDPDADSLLTQDRRAQSHEAQRRSRWLGHEEALRRKLETTSLPAPQLKPDMLAAMLMIEADTTELMIQLSMPALATSTAVDPPIEELRERNTAKTALASRQRALAEFKAWFFRERAADGRDPPLRPAEARHRRLNRGRSSNAWALRRPHDEQTPKR